MEEKSRNGIDFTERDALDKFSDFKYLRLSKKAILEIAYSLTYVYAGESGNQANILQAGNAFHYDFLNSFRRNVSNKINAFPVKFRRKCCSEFAQKFFTYTLGCGGFILEAAWNLGHLKHFTPGYSSAAIGLGLLITAAFMPSFLGSMRWELLSLTSYRQYDRAFHALGQKLPFDVKTQSIAQRYAYRALPQTKMDTARFITREMCLCFYKTPTDAEEPLLGDGAGLV